MAKRPPAGKRGKTTDFALTEKQLKVLINAAKPGKVKSALIMMSEGHSVKEISPLLGVTSVTLWRWVKKLSAKCFPDLDPEHLPFPNSLRKPREE